LGAPYRDDSGRRRARRGRRRGGGGIIQAAINSPTCIIVCALRCACCDAAQRACAARAAAAAAAAAAPRGAMLPLVTTLLLLPPVVAAPSLSSSVAQLSTPAITIQFDGTSKVTAVTDRLGGRSLLYSVSAGHHPGTLLSVVFGPNETIPAPPLSARFTAASGGNGGGTIVATFSGGAVVTVNATTADEDMITLIVTGVTPGSKAITDLHIFNVPIAMQSCSNGPVAVFDSAFAMLMMPHEPDWRTNVYAAAPVGAYYMGKPAPVVDCNGTAGVILQARAWNLTGKVDGALVGRGAALWAGKRSALDAAIQGGEKRFNLPRPMIDGVWAKRNAHAGYFLISITPETLDDAIKFAKQSGITYLTFLDDIWEGAGHYNVSTMWGGLKGLTAAVGKIKAAGLKAGCHTMSGNIVKTDPYVTPVPDPRLAKTVGGQRTLARAVSANDTWLPLLESPAGLPVPYGVQPPRTGTDMQIGSEIVRYLSINITAPFGLAGVVRGMYGTTAAAHDAGAKVEHMAQLYDGFLPDPETTLMDEVGENMAWAFKEIGFSMIYFDGLEAHSMTGPTVGDGEVIPGFAEARLHQAFWEHLDGHDALVESSSGSGPLWHLNTRTGQTDWAGTDRRAYMDYGKGPRMRSASCASLVTPDIGWWGYNLFAAGSYRATTPDEVEYMAARSRAWDAAPNFETSTAALMTNGRTMEAFGRMRPWLTLELPAAAKLVLRQIDTDFMLHAADEDDSKSFIVPGKMHESRIADPAHTASCRWALTPAYPPVDKARLGLRLRALPAVASTAMGSAMGSAIDLLKLSGAVTRSRSCTPHGSASNLVTTSVAPPGAAPSALLLNYTADPRATGDGDDDVGCSLNLYAAPLNLTVNRVLEAVIIGDNSNALVSFQLQDTGGGFRNYFVNLDFSGSRTFRLSIPESRALYTHRGGRFPSPEDNKMAMRDYNWASTLALNIFVTGAKRTQAYISSLTALVESAAAIKPGSTITLAGQTITLKTSLRAFPCLVGGRGPEGGGGHAGENNCEDYLECSDLSNASSCSAFDANNNLLRNHAATIRAASQPASVSGGTSSAASREAQIVYAAAAGSMARAEVTVIESSSQRMGPFGHSASVV
jgi:hypothetical protein